MSVQVLNQTTVIPAHFVPTRKDLTFVGASKVLRVMAKTAQVKIALGTVCLLLVQVVKSFHYFLGTRVSDRGLTRGSSIFLGCFPSFGPMTCVCPVIGYESRR